MHIAITNPEHIAYIHANGAPAQIAELAGLRECEASADGSSGEFHYAPITNETTYIVFDGKKLKNKPYDRHLKLTYCDDHEATLAERQRQGKTTLVPC